MATKKKSGTALMTSDEEKEEAERLKKALKDPQPGNGPIKVGFRIKGSLTVFWLTASYGEVIVIDPNRDRIIVHVEASTDPLYGSEKK